MALIKLSTGDWVDPAEVIAISRELEGGITYIHAKSETVLSCSVPSGTIAAEINAALAVEPQKGGAEMGANAPKELWMLWVAKSHSFLEADDGDDSYCAYLSEKDAKDGAEYQNAAYEIYAVPVRVK